MNKKNSIIDHKLDSMVENKISDMTVDVIQINKKIDRFKVQIDDFYTLLESNVGKFENQRVLNNKIIAVQRLLYATKMGLDRQKMKMYDIDQTLVKEEIIRSM